MLSKNDFYNLRKQVVLNSLFINDYNNNLYIKPETVCNFFNSAVEYINDEYKAKNNNDIELSKITTKKLYDYYKTFECDPLSRDDFIAHYNFTVFNGLLIYDIFYGINDYVLMAEFYHSDVVGMKVYKMCKHKIYYDSDTPYIKHNNQRFNINDFRRVN